MRGHVAYYGIIGNLRTVQTFRGEVKQVWHKGLNRRSLRHGMTGRGSRVFASATRYQPYVLCNHRR